MIIRPLTLLALAAAALLLGDKSHAQVQVTVGHNADADATPGFLFKNVPQPARNDAAAEATFSLVDGRRDPNGGDLPKLNDGRVPSDEDQPSANFFFRPNTDGGRLLLDLGRKIEVKQVNTYSWHANTRGPQVYDLYAADGQASEFNARPSRGVDPATCGWTLLARVDTRPKTGESGGQFGVSVSNTTDAIGSYQYLLFDMFRTEEADPFGNTFYSEIDVLDRQGPAPEPIATPQPGQGQEVVEIGEGKYRITIDTSETPDLSEWAKTELTPVVREWYPKLATLLASDGYEAPSRVAIVFSANMGGVAATSGTRVRCAAEWIRRNLEGEAKGSVVHELVHVVQQYGRARRTRPNASRAPGWLVEGIADYIRWYLYEPQSRGAEITTRNLARARYDASYRVTANFLNWVTEQYDKDLVPKFNAAIRDGLYEEDLWKQRTGRTAQELGDEWKTALEKKLKPEAASPADSTGQPVPPAETGQGSSRQSPDR